MESTSSDLVMDSRDMISSSILLSSPVLPTPPCPWSSAGPAMVLSSILRLPSSIEFLKRMAPSLRFTPRMAHRRRTSYSELSSILSVIPLPFTRPMTSSLRDPTFKRKWRKISTTKCLPPPGTRSSSSSFDPSLYPTLLRTRFKTQKWRVRTSTPLRPNSKEKLWSTRPT